MIDVENLQVEVQARANALTGTPTDEQVIEVGIAARSVELAGGVINRTVLDVAIQNVIDGVSGVDANADLIALGATLPRTTSSGTVGGPEVGTYVTGLFNGNTKYLPCNNSTYLRSAYPELTDLMISGLSQQVSISASESTNITSTPTSEAQSTIFKVNDKYYKLLGGSSSTSNWTVIPIQVSTDGVVYLPVLAPSMASPITISGANVQMDVLISVGTTLLAYGRMLADGSNYIIQLKSLDDGVTWLFSTVRTVTSSYSSLTNPVMASMIGTTVLVHPRGEQATTVRYTTNLGNTWVNLSDTDVANSKYINGLIQDGTRFVVGFTDGSSAYSTTSDPSGSTWTAVASPSANARGVLGVVSGKWIMGGVSGYVATCTTPGTWVAQTACTGGMPTFSIEYILVNGSTIAFSALTDTSQVFYCTDASTLPVVSVVVVDTVVGSPTKLNLVTVSGGYFYLRQGGDTLIRSSSLTADSFTPVQASFNIVGVGAFDTVSCGAVKKYGYYFYSSGGTGQNKRYMSSDLKNWFTAPANIVTGCGAVVDAGTRLLALDDNQLLWQSTDGRTWDTAGITRPSLGGAGPYSTHGRLYVCRNGWIYYTVFRGDANSYTVYVSKNNGSTWTAVAGLGFAGAVNTYPSVLGNPCLFREIGGNIYSLSVNYYTTGYGYSLSRSTDGVNFTLITSTADAQAAVNVVQRNGIFEVSGIIYVLVVGTPTVWLASYDNGINFTAVPATFIPANLGVLGITSSQFVVNNISSADFLYVNTTSPLTFRRLSGPTLETSSNYVTNNNSKSPVFIYDDGELSMLTATSEGVPRLIHLADANTTFTLPSLSNTWLRASS